VSQVLKVLLDRRVKLAQPVPKDPQEFKAKPALRVRLAK
jgi:hypothetical protein